MVGYRHRSRGGPDRIGAEGQGGFVYGTTPHAPEAERQDAFADTGVSRALSLAATLIDAAPVGLSKAEIRERVEHYRPEGETSREAFEQQFNRDKRTLRRLGIDITSLGSEDEGRDGHGGDHDFRYVIDPEAHGLPPLRIPADEVIALRHAELLWSGTRAQAAIRQAAGALTALQASEPAGDRAAAASTADPEAAQVPGALPPPASVRLGLADDHVLDHLGTLADSLTTAAVAFTYSPRGRHRAQQRRTVPLGVGSRGGWYLVGHDLDRDAVRVYRLDRIRGDITRLTAPDDSIRTVLKQIADGRIDPPQVTREQLETLGPAHGTETVELEADADVAATFLPHARHDPVSSEASHDEAVRLTVETTLHDSFLGKIAVALPRVRVLSGERLTALVRRHLEAVRRAHRDSPVPAEELRAPRTSTTNDAGAKIARVMSMAAYLHATGGARASDLLERYSITPRQLHRDLLSLQQSAAFDSAQFGHYIDIDPELPLTRRVFEKQLLAEDPVIRIDLPGSRLQDTLGRPLRLTAPQALSVLIALEGLIASQDPDTEPVRRAAARLRDRIRAIVPAELDATAAELSVAWQSADEFGHEAVLRKALDGEHAVELLYEDVQNRRTRRVVDPVTLLHDGARTYLRAWCRSVEGERNFLLGRVLDLTPMPDTPLSDQARALATEPARRPEVPRRRDDELVILRFAPSAAADADAWAPVREVWGEDGARTVEVALRSGSIAVDLALRSGGDVTVLQPEELAGEVVRRAERGLAALGDGASSSVEYPGGQTKGRTP